jgi:UDP-N-acetylmuramoyl-tripeptide--D-alanyl-D-alanine ligase
LELFTVPQIAEYTNGRVYGENRGKICAVRIDSRKPGSNFLFIPLKGARVDGHDYIEQAFRNGAAASLVSEKDFNKHKNDGGSFIIVDDTFRALHVLASSHLAKMKNLIKTGVTGSNGKTTTKEIIGSILSVSKNTVINEGNLNSEIGVPLAVFSVKPEHKYAVFELGMDHEGEMDKIAGLIKPDYALITNIGIAHIEQLKTKKNIAGEKKKIFKFFDGKQYGFIYEKEKYFDFLKKDVRGTVIPYGFESTEGYKSCKDLGLEGTVIYWKDMEIKFPLFGLHNLRNALGAVSVALCLGIKQEDVKEGLEKVKPLFGRSEIIKGAVTIIRDCYNSNPDSAKAVLEFFEKLNLKKGKKVVLLGSMLELGNKSEKEHISVVNFARKRKIDLILLFGNEMQAAYEYVKEDTHVFWAKEFDVMAGILKRNIKQGDMVLIKGSRGMELERFVEPIKRAAA